MALNVALVHVGRERELRLSDSSKTRDFKYTMWGLYRPIGHVTVILYYENEHESSLTLFLSDQGCSFWVGSRIRVQQQSFKLLNSKYLSHEEVCVRENDHRRKFYMDKHSHQCQARPAAAYLPA